MYLLSEILKSDSRTKTKSSVHSVTLLLGYIGGDFTQYQAQWADPNTQTLPRIAAWTRSRRLKVFTLMAPVRNFSLTEVEAVSGVLQTTSEEIWIECFSKQVCSRIKHLLIFLSWQGEKQLNSSTVDETWQVSLPEGCLGGSIRWRCRCWGDRCKRQWTWLDGWTECLSSEGNHTNTSQLWAQTAKHQILRPFDYLARRLYFYILRRIHAQGTM